jgi:hypothetical protein
MRKFGAVMKSKGPTDNDPDDFAPTSRSSGWKSLSVRKDPHKEQPMWLEPEAPQLGAPELRGAQNPAPSSGDILILCPRTNIPVSTGLKVAWVVFKSLPPVAVPLHCPACGHVHRWKPKDAWIDPRDDSDEPNPA